MIRFTSQNLLRVYNYYYFLKNGLKCYHPVKEAANARENHIKDNSSFEVLQQIIVHTLDQHSIENRYRIGWW